MKKIQVLMSTYNGEKYLRKQIDSILNQKNIMVSLLVRDDGSTDRTKIILEEYLKNGLLQFYIGDNLGPALSFLDLILKSDNSCDYFSFSDQDDIWLENKLEIAISTFIKPSIAQLYYSNTMMIDKNCKIMKKTKCKSTDTFDRSVIVNNSLGCTMVFNKILRDIINIYSPQKISMHDWWIYKLCLSIDGMIVFDDDYHMYYRQHGTNVVGPGGFFGKYNKWKRRLKIVLLTDKHIRENDALEILRGYESHITQDKLKLLNLICYYRKNFNKKIRLLFYPIKGLTFEQVILKYISILINKF
jgi:rhamnosyltransferase